MELRSHSTNMELSNLSPLTVSKKELTQHDHIIVIILNCYNKDVEVHNLETEYI